MGKGNKKKKSGEAPKGLSFSPISNIQASDMLTMIQKNDNLPKEVQNAFILSNDGKRLEVRDVKVPKQWQDAFGSLRIAVNNGNWEMTTAQTSMTKKNDSSQLLPDVEAGDHPGHRTIGPNKPGELGGKMPDKWSTDPDMPSDKGDILGVTYGPEGKKNPNKETWSGSIMRDDPPNNERENGKRGLIVVADRVKDSDGKVVNLKESEHGENMMVATLFHEAILHAGHFEQGKLAGHTYQEKLDEAEKIGPREKMRAEDELTDAEKELRNEDQFLCDEFKEGERQNNLGGIVKSIRDANPKKYGTESKEKDAKDSPPQPKEVPKGTEPDKPKDAKETKKSENDAFKNNNLDNAEVNKEEEKEQVAQPMNDRDKENAAFAAQFVKDNSKDSTDAGRDASNAVNKNSQDQQNANQNMV